MSNIRNEIDEVLKQSDKNQKYEDSEEKKYKNLLHNINIKIKKANLKSTREKLLEKKKEIQNDLNECRRIGYYCQKSIHCHLTELFNKLNYD